MKVYRTIYYGEVLLNLVSALLAILLPGYFLAQLTSPAAGLSQPTTSLGQLPQSDLAIEMARWFGGLMVVLTWVGWRILRSRDQRALRNMLEAFLIGDIVHFFLLAQLLRVVGVFSLGACFDVVATVSLAISRILFLWQTRNGRTLDIEP